MAIRNVTKDIFDSNSTKGYVKVSILDYSRKKLFQAKLSFKNPISLKSSLLKHHFRKFVKTDI